MLHFAAFNKVLRQFDYQIEKEDYFKNYLGLTDIDLFVELIESGKLKADASIVMDLFEQKKKIFQQLAKKDCRIINGVPEFLQRLKDENIPVAICSGAVLEDIELILGSAVLLDFFDVIVSADDVEKGKPEPDGFLLALERLNESAAPRISASDCVVIEDSHWGLVAAEKAGMHTVAVTNSYSAEELQSADKIVNNLNELIVDDLQNLCT
jgi:HAD superfamily hydrolase (TIGR01509 family)